MDGRVEPGKISFDFHADNAVAIRAAKAAQVQCIRKLIKIGWNKTVPLTIASIRTAGIAQALSNLNCVPGHKYH